MIKINNDEVEITKNKIKKEILPYERKPEDGDDTHKIVEATSYEYFACTCDDKDEAYFKELLKKEFPKCDGLYATSLIYSLEGEGWYFDGCCADQWMGLAISNCNNSDSMVIQCDFMEYGLLAAYLIAKQINEKKDN